MTRAYVLRPFGGTAADAGIAATEYVVVVASLVIALLALTAVGSLDPACSAGAAPCGNVFMRLADALGDAFSTTSFLLSMPF